MNCGVENCKNNVVGYMSVDTFGKNPLDDNDERHRTTNIYFCLKHLKEKFIE